MAPRKDSPPAKRPSQLKFRHWRSLPAKVFTQINDDRIGLTAAGVAFYTLLAIFPGIAAAVSIWGLAADPADMPAQLQMLRGVLPSEVMQLLSTQASEIANEDDSVVGVTLAFTLILFFLSASRGVKSLMQALNIVYGEKEKRGFFHFNAVAFLMTVTAVFGFVVAIAVLAVMPFLFEFAGIGGFVDPFFGVLRWPLLFVAAWAAIAAFYRFAPSRNDPSWKLISPGAGAAVIMWLFASVIFSIYVQNFAKYNETYGSIGAVVVLLMWFWLSAFVFLVGAEIDSEIEQTKDEIASDGAPRKAKKSSG